MTDQDPAYEVADVEFDAEGATLRGWLYRPRTGDSVAPVVVMAHGYNCLKEFYLDRYAEAVANAGHVVLAYDHRCFGDSEGEPRQELDPWVQVRDYRHAITFAQTLDGVDPDRIGVWGSSYAGGHVLVVAAIDRRVGCVVAQVPTISGWVHVAPRAATCVGRPAPPLGRRPRRALSWQTAEDGADGRRSLRGRSRLARERRRLAVLHRPEVAARGSMAISQVAE